MLMPETAIHEDHGSIARQHQVRFSRQILCMQPVAKSGRMQGLSDLQFRAGMAAFNGRHIPATRGSVVNVCQGSGSFAFVSRLHQRLNVRLHDPGDCLENRDCDRIAKLLVGLGVGHRNPEIVRIAHQAGAFARR